MKTRNQVTPEFPEPVTARRQLRRGKTQAFSFSEGGKNMKPKATVGMFSWDKPHSGKTKKELIELVRELKLDSQGAWDFATREKLRCDQETEKLQKAISQWQAAAINWMEKCCQYRANALPQTAMPLQEKPSMTTRGKVIHLLRPDNR